MFGRTNSQKANLLSADNRQILSWLFLIIVSIISALLISTETAKALIEINNINQASVRLIHKVKVVEKPGVIMTVTAFNAGDSAQTDDDPCIAATGDNICELLEKGKQVCALNSVPFYTVLKIDKLGECIVLDRTNSRFQNRVDWAMKLDEKERALKFGKQNLEVKIISTK